MKQRYTMRRFSRLGGHNMRRSGVFNCILCHNLKAKASPRPTAQPDSAVPQQSSAPQTPAGAEFTKDWNAATDAQLKPVYLKPTRSRFRKPSVYFARGATRSASAAAGTATDGVVSVPTSLVKAENLGLAMPLYKVTSASCDYFALRIPLLKAGFKRVGPQLPGVDPNVLWGKSWPTSAFKVNATTDEAWQHARPVHRLQRINHFAGSHATMGCKAGMARSIDAATALCVGAGKHDAAQSFQSLCPRTWRLPEEGSVLLKHLSTAAGRAARYIVKPARGSCGRGIRVVDSSSNFLRTLASTSDPQQLANAMGEIPADASAASAAPRSTSNTEPHSPDDAQPLRPRLIVVQEYMEDPLLIDGRKFDLRLYVGVTSFDPLVAYLHQDGLVRFAAEAYDNEHAENRFGHLTNYSLGRKLEQKYSKELAVQMGLIDSVDDPRLEDPEANIQLPHVSLQLKWPMQKLHERLASDFGAPAVAKLQDDIDRVIVSMLLAAGRSINRVAEAEHDGGVNRCSFELLGFDIMIDKNLRPWLIEVNTLPSLESSSVLDYDIKSNVATDLLNLAQIQLYERLPSAFETTTGANLEMPSALRHVPSEAVAAGFVHGVGEVWRTSGAVGALGPLLDANEAAEDVVARVADEGDFTGGFRRIFPAAPHTHVARNLFAAEGRKTASLHCTDALWSSLQL
jgi:hypothetical protein